MAVGDNAELFVTAAASIQLDDNIYMDPDIPTAPAIDDVIYSFTPGVDLVFGKGSVTKGNLYYREEIRRYSDNGNQDTELSNVGLKTSYDNGVTKADFNASYAQIAQNDNNTFNSVGVIARREVTALGAKLEFAISEKTSVAGGASFDKTEYAQASYTDSDVLSIPVDVYYKATAKLDWSLGYRYRSTELSGSGRDSTDHFFNIGARGEFTPKLNGQIRVGVTQRSFDVGGDDSTFGLDGRLTYLFSEKTSYNLTFGNDYGSSGFGESTENFNLGVNVTSKISEVWSLMGGLNYRKGEFPTRTDDFIDASLSATYTLNNVVNFTASYTYRNNASDSALAEFTNNVFSIGANIRY